MSASTPGPQPVSLFGWDDWTQVEGGKWRSPGGRVLSDPVYQRMKGQGGKRETAPKRPTAAAAQQRPAAAGLGRPAPGKNGRAIGTAARDRRAGKEITPERRDEVLTAVTALSKPALYGVGLAVGVEWPPKGISHEEMRKAVAERVLGPGAWPGSSAGHAPPAAASASPTPPPAQADDAKALAASLAGAAAAVGGGKPPAPVRRVKQRAGFTRLEQLMDLSPQQQEEELLRRSARATPEEQVAVRAAAAVRPQPEVTAAVDAQKADLDARHGERGSRILRAVADVVGRTARAAKDPRLLAPAAGAAAGGGLGAVVGTLVGGPFGVGVGTSVGAGLGLMIGDRLGRYMTASRLKVAARKLLRETAPAAAGTLAGAGAAAVAWPLAGAGASYAVTPAGVTSQVLGIDVWGSVVKLAGAPFKLAGLVYGGLRRAIEPSAAKDRKRRGDSLRVPRKMAEEPDPVAEARRVMERAGVDASAVSDEKVALALAIAAAVEDSAPEPGVEAFAWDDWKQQPNGSWKSPGGRVLSDQNYQAMRRSGAAEPQPGVVGKVADKARAATAAAGKAMAGTKVGRAAQRVDSAVGRAAGRFTQRVVEWKDKRAAALKQKAMEGKFGGLLQWAAGTAVGRAFFRDLERRGDRVRMTAREAQELGLVGAKLNGAERVIAFVQESFDRNRRRYGVVPAALIEGAVAAVKFALPPVVVGAAATAGAAAGFLGGGPAAGAAAGLAAGALGVGFTRWLTKSLIGKGMSSAARAVGETAAASVKKLIAGKSRVRARNGAEVNLRLAPKPAQPVSANAEGGAGPTVADLIAEVQRRAGEELDLDLPPELAADLLTQLAEKMPQAIESEGSLAV